MKRLTLFVSLLIVLIMVAGISFVQMQQSVVRAGNKNLEIIEPEMVTDIEAVEFAGALLPPEEAITYTPVALDKPIITADHRPVAQFASAPAGFEQQVVTFLPELTEIPPGEISYVIISTVKYGGATGSLIVTTSQASATAREKPLVLGNDTVQLNNGQKVWTFINDYTPDVRNQVAWQHEDLIITLASDVPLERLLELVKEVTILR